MANTFKSTLNINIETTGNTVYTCPASNVATIIGLSLSNKTNSTVTANLFLTRGATECSILSGVNIPPGNSLIPVGGDQKLVVQASDTIKATTSANSSLDIIVSLLEIS
jgi:hypothetical protein